MSVDGLRERVTIDRHVSGPEFIARGVEGIGRRGVESGLLGFGEARSKCLGKEHTEIVICGLQ